MDQVTKMLLFFAVLFASADPASVAQQKIDCESPVSVTLVAILADDNEFDGQCVRTTGLYSWGFDGSFLYLSSDHERYSTMGVLVLETRDTLYRSPHGKLVKPEALDGRFVSVTGVVRGREEVIGDYRPAVVDVTSIVGLARR